MTRLGAYGLGVATVVGSAAAWGHDLETFGFAVLIVAVSLLHCVVCAKK